MRGFSLIQSCNAGFSSQNIYLSNICGVAGDQQASELDLHRQGVIRPQSRPSVLLSPDASVSRSGVGSSRSTVLCLFKAFPVGRAGRKDEEAHLSL